MEKKGKRGEKKGKKSGKGEREEKTIKRRRYIMIINTELTQS